MFLFIYQLNMPGYQPNHALYFSNNFCNIFLKTSTNVKQVNTSVMINKTASILMARTFVSVNLDSQRMTKETVVKVNTGLFFHCC